jgi:hypothetical protein
MDDSAPDRRRSLVIGAVAIAILALGLTALVRQWRPAAPPGASTSAPADTGDAVIDQALGQIPASADSAEIKARWMDDIKGIEIAALDDAQRDLFVRFANARRCTCGCGFTLAACRTYDPTCPVSEPILEALRDSITAGRIRSANGLRERPPGG